MPPPLEPLPVEPPLPDEPPPLVVPPPLVLPPPPVVPPPLVLPLPQLSVSFTAPDIWFAMLGFPTACTNALYEPLGIE